MIEVEGDMMTGFELFGKAHLIWLTISVICIALIYVLNRRVDERARLRLSWGLAWLTLLSHLAESGFRIHEGSYSIYTLPLHICALTSYLVFIHRIRPRRPLGEILFCPGIAGASAVFFYERHRLYRAYRDHSLYPAGDLEQIDHAIDQKSVYTCPVPGGIRAHHDPV